MLARNHIRADGCRALAAALTSNEQGALEFLNLGGNPDIGDDGAIALAKALGASSTLTTLRLWKCGLTDAVAPQFKEALRLRAERRGPGGARLEPIRDISMFDNEITPECQRELEHLARESGACDDDSRTNLFHFQMKDHDKELPSSAGRKASMVSSK